MVALSGHVSNRAQCLGKLRVCYNTILRRMLGVPTWNCAKNMFAIFNVCSLQEALIFATYSLSTRI